SALENEDSIRDCTPKLLFADAAFAAMGAGLAEKVGSIRLVYADDAPNPIASTRALDFEMLVAKAQPIEDAQVPETELCGIFYTGGTTGRSKGVMLSQRNLMSNARNMMAGGLASRRGTYLHVAPMFHLANAAAMYVHFLAGGSHGIIRAFAPEPMAQA